MRTYAQLSLEERYQIEARLGLKQTPYQIARELGRHPSTIYREIRRNNDSVDRNGEWHMKPYTARRAQKRTRVRRVKKGAAQRKIRGPLKKLVESKLRLSWSPEQISGRLLLEQGIRISHETIYQHILRDSKELGFYRYCLRFGGYKHHRFKKSKAAERTRARKKWIDDRPAAANDRTEVGHWERDSLLGKRGGSAMLTLIDRKSRYVKLVHVPSVETETVARATVRGLRGLPIKTITNDCGVEFQREESLQMKLGVPIYFCNPGSPWERGSVENANGLIRQYLPSGSDFDALGSWAPVAVEETLNLRPRKVLGFRTPHEALFDQTINLTKDQTMHFGLEFSRHT